MDDSAGLALVFFGNVGKGSLTGWGFESGLSGVSPVSPDLRFRVAGILTELPRETGRASNQKHQLQSRAIPHSGR